VFADASLGIIWQRWESSLQYSKKKSTLEFITKPQEFIRQLIEAFYSLHRK
jgi:hypothetical protein